MLRKGTLLTWPKVQNCDGKGCNLEAHDGGEYDAVVSISGLPTDSPPRTSCSELPAMDRVTDNPNPLRRALLTLCPRRNSPPPSPEN